MENAFLSWRLTAEILAHVIIIFPKGLITSKSCALGLENGQLSLQISVFNKAGLILFSYKAAVSSTLLETN